MSETKMSEMIRASLDGIRDFSQTESVVGNIITTASGVTVIPVSRVTVGLATAGIDYGARKFSTPQSFGGGGGTGATITPIAFLIVTKNGETKILHLNDGKDSVKRICDLLENAPEIVERIKNSLT